MSAKDNTNKSRSMELTADEVVSIKEALKEADEALAYAYLDAETDERRDRYLLSINKIASALEVFIR